MAAKLPVTDSVAAAISNVAAEMFGVITRTVLFNHTAASSSMNRLSRRYRSSNHLLVLNESGA